LPFNFKEENEEKTTIDAAIFNEYVEHMVLLLNEILNVTKTFEEKV